MITFVLPYPRDEQGLDHWPCPSKAFPHSLAHSEKWQGSFAVEVGVVQNGEATLA